MKPEKINTKAMRRRLRNTKIPTGIAELLEKQNVKTSLDWSDFPPDQKREIVVEWTLNSGIVEGKKYSTKELYLKLGITYERLRNILSNIELEISKNLTTNNTMRNHIFTMVYRLSNQIQQDRAAAMMHANILDSELTYIVDEIEKIKKLSENDTKERRDKEAALHRLYGYLKSFSFYKLETFKACFQATELGVNFLQLFAGKGKEKGLSDFAKDDLDPDGGKKDNEYLTSTKALAILEATQGQILPVQDLSKMDDVVRNPNEGFEDLVDKRPPNADNNGRI